MSVRIIIDSASDLTKEQADKLGLDFLPLKTIFGTEEYLDGITLSHQQFYEKLIGLIHDNISNSEFGITNICEELNISRTQLYRKVKAVTDIPISTLIRNLRMEKAYELFKNNDYTVSEVMYQVGINSNSYFTKTFKEYFNILPSEFIKQTYKK